MFKSGNMAALSLFMILLGKGLFAQSTVKKPLVLSDQKFAKDFLIGSWISEDSLIPAMKFVASPSGLIIDQHLAGMSKYTFPGTTDSVSNRGFAAGWPPYYCQLDLTEDGALQATFYQFQDMILNQVQFRRKP